MILSNVGQLLYSVEPDLDGYRYLATWKVEHLDIATMSNDRIIMVHPHPKERGITRLLNHWDTEDCERYHETPDAALDYERKVLQARIETANRMRDRFVAYLRALDDIRENLRFAAIEEFEKNRKGP